jgi:hypothetical protein
LSERTKKRDRRQAKSAAVAPALVVAEGSAGARSLNHVVARGTLYSFSPEGAGLVPLVGGTMIGEAVWLTPLLVILGGAGIVMLVSRPVRNFLLRAPHEHHRCPVTHEDVDSTILEDVRTGEWKDVEKCSGRRGDLKHRCTQQCAKIHNRALGQPS